MKFVCCQIKLMSATPDLYDFGCGSFWYHGIISLIFASHFSLSVCCNGQKTIFQSEQRASKNNVKAVNMHSAICLSPIGINFTKNFLYPVGTFGLKYPSSLWTCPGLYYKSSQLYKECFAVFASSMHSNSMHSKHWWWWRLMMMKTDDDED